MNGTNMRRVMMAVAAAATLHVGTAWCHAEKPKPDSGGAQPSAAAPVASEVGGTRDARTYFTDLEVLTQDGRKVRFYTDMLEGRTVLINVIFTDCKDACPLITQQLNEVRRRIPDLFGTQVFFVTLSSDPIVDTPRLLKQFAQKQSADVAGWTFLTGKKDHIDHILKKLGQFAEDRENHSTLIIAGNVPARRWTKIRPNAQPAAIAERLAVLAAASAAPGAKP